jgi:hypothetical protein
MDSGKSTFSIFATLKIGYQLRVVYVLLYSLENPRFEGFGRLLAQFSLDLTGVNGICRLWTRP